MSDFDPKAYLASKKLPPKQDSTETFDPKAYLAAKRGSVAGSPLEQALESQPGEVVTVQTPTGPAQFTRSGERFYGPEESALLGDAGHVGLKEKALENGLTFFGNGGPTAAMAGMSAVMRPDVLSGRREGEGSFDLYRRVRDDAKRSMGVAERHGPQVSADIPRVGPVQFNPVALAGAAAPSLLAPNPTSVLGRLALGGAVGGGQAAIQSDADLTRGEVVPFLKDTGRGMVFGAGASGIAEGVTAPMRMIGRGAASRIGNEAAQRATADAADVAEEIASTRGTLGAESTKAGLMRRNLLGAIDEPTANLTPGAGAVSDAARQDALAALRDPEAVRLAEKTLSRNRVEYPNQISKIQGLESDLASQVANAEQEAGRRTSDYFGQSTWKTEVRPRLATLGENALLGAAAGGVTGGATGLATAVTGATPTQSLMSGIISGIGTSALAGGSGLKTLGKNALASPRLRVSALEGLIQASQAAQKTAQAGARSSAAAEPKLEQELISAKKASVFDDRTLLQLVEVGFAFREL